MEILYLIIGALLGFALERSNDAITPRLRLRRLKYILPIINPADQRDIFIRPSIEVLTAGSGGRSKRAYTHSCETIALQTLSRVFHGLPINLIFSYNDFASTEYAGWILLGLSREKSKISESLFEQIKQETKIRVVKGQGTHQFIQDASGKQYKCQHVDDDEFETKVTKDYGLIYRGVSNNGNAILLCGGIHMFGTQAAVEVALSEPFIERIRSAKSFAFAQVVEVAVRDDGITIDPGSIRWRDLPFVSVKANKEDLRAIQKS
jgi:hypothetical protein